MKGAVSMKILSIETSAVCASVAITDDNKIISRFSINAKLTHSRTLLPMIDAALSDSETKIEDIDCFACSVGPGSFTGIRIGIAAVKGLADATGKKCVAVSTLEALAYNLKGGSCLACAVMDARCDQVYCALFDVEGNTIKRVTEDSAISLEELKVRLEGSEKRVVFVGDGAELCQNRIGYEAASELVRYQDAASVGLCAYYGFDSSKLLDAAELSPVYLRLPQAERELKNKKK